MRARSPVAQSTASRTYPAIAISAARRLRLTVPDRTLTWAGASPPVQSNRLICALGVGWWAPGRGRPGWKRYRPGHGHQSL